MCDIWLWKWQKASIYLSETVQCVHMLKWHKASIYLSKTVPCFHIFEVEIIASKRHPFVDNCPKCASQLWIWICHQFKSIKYLLAMPCLQVMSKIQLSINFDVLFITRNQYYNLQLTYSPNINPPITYYFNS